MGNTLPKDKEAKKDVQKHTPKEKEAHPKEVQKITTKEAHPSKEAEKPAHPPPPLLLPHDKKEHAEKPKEKKSPEKKKGSEKHVEKKDTKLKDKEKKDDKKPSVKKVRKSESAHEPKGGTQQTQPTDPPKISKEELKKSKSAHRLGKKTPNSDMSPAEITEFERVRVKVRAAKSKKSNKSMGKSLQSEESDGCENMMSKDKI